MGLSTKHVYTLMTYGAPFSKFDGYVLDDGIQYKHAMSAFIVLHFTKPDIAFAVNFFLPVYA